MGYPLESLEWHTLSFIADQVFEKAERLEPDALTEIERSFWTVWISDGHIVGGTIYRFFHLCPELLDALVDAYRAVGMSKKAEAVKQMLALLPEPSLLEEERLAQVVAIQEQDHARDERIQNLHSTYYDSDDHFDEGLYRFVQNHRREFLPEA